MTRRAFTVPEFLMAITIIAVSTVVLRHYLFRVPPLARDASCSSNVKQLTIALLSYAQDYGGKLPPGPKDWAPVNPYVKNSQVLVCPAEGFRESGGTNRADYLFNWHLSSDDRPQEVLVGDDVPARHRGRWIGARLDTAVFVWPQSQWQTRLGWLNANASETRPGAR